MPANLVSATLRGGLFTRKIGKRVLFFQELDSTMDEALRQADAGGEDGTVIVAETQTASRGRMGRTWVSQPRNLYLSVLVYPTLNTLPFLSCIGALVTVRAIRKAAGVSARIKWPNDVLVGGKKVAGILVESAISGDAVHHAIVGIGINVALETQSVDEIASFATGLDAEAGRAVSRENLLRQLLQEFDSLYLKLLQGDTPMEAWRGLLDTLGQRIQVTWRQDKFIGYAEDLDDLGNLLLRLDDGQLITLTAGDVTLETGR